MFKILEHLPYIIKLQIIIWVLMPENLTFLHTNNKDAEQPAHLRSLISTFVSIIANLAICKRAMCIEKLRYKTCFSSISSY